MRVSKLTPSYLAYMSDFHTQRENKTEWKRWLKEVTWWPKTTRHWSLDSLIRIKGHSHFRTTAFKTSPLTCRSGSSVSSPGREAQILLSSLCFRLFPEPASSCGLRCLAPLLPGWGHGCRPTFFLECVMTHDYLSTGANTVVPAQQQEDRRPCSGSPLKSYSPESEHGRCSAKSFESMTE